KDLQPEGLAACFSQLLPIVEVTLQGVVDKLGQREPWFVVEMAEHGKDPHAGSNAHRFFARALGHTLGVSWAQLTLGVRQEGLSNRPHYANMHGVSERCEGRASGFRKAMGVRKALET